MREVTHSKILAYNHVHKIKSKFESLGIFAQDILLKPYTTDALNGIILGHAQKHSGMFCNAWSHCKFVSD